MPLPSKSPTSGLGLPGMVRGTEVWAPAAVVKRHMESGPAPGEYQMILSLRANGEVRLGQHHRGVGARDALRHRRGVPVVELPQEVGRGPWSVPEDVVAHVAGEVAHHRGVGAVDLHGCGGLGEGPVAVADPELLRGGAWRVPEDVAVGGAAEVADDGDVGAAHAHRRSGVLDEPPARGGRRLPGASEQHQGGGSEHRRQVPDSTMCCHVAPPFGAMPGAPRGVEPTKGVRSRPGPMWPRSAPGINR